MRLFQTFLKQIPERFRTVFIVQHRESLTLYSHIYTRDINLYYICQFYKLLEHYRYGREHAWHHCIMHAKYHDYSD